MVWLPAHAAVRGKELNVLLPLGGADGCVRYLKMEQVVDVLQAQAAGLRSGCGFLMDPTAATSLTLLRDTPMAACTLAIGPEGGWSTRDREQLQAAGFAGLRLGPRILRTETAGLAAIAALQVLAGDLG